VSQTFEEQFTKAKDKSKKNIGGYFFWLRKFLETNPNAIELYLVVGVVHRVMAALKDKHWEKMSPQVKDEAVRNKIREVLDSAIEELAVDIDTTLIKKNEGGIWTPEEKSIIQ
jgi:hypothetical protein